MNLLNMDIDRADIRLSHDELDMIRNVMNELCNGVRIEDWEFQTRIGWNRATVQGLLNQLNGVAGDVI